MKNILFILLVFVTSVSYGQRFKKFEINAGVSLFAPITKDIAWDDKAWGQRLQFVMSENKQFSYVLNMGIQQNKSRDIQLPVLLSLRHVVYKNIYVTYGTGATFLKNDNTRFTLTTGWGVIMKRFVIEQSIFRTTAGQNRPTPHFNNLGVSVLYRL